MKPLHDLMIVLSHLVVTLLVLVLQDVVDAFECSSFQLVDLIVQDLQPSDANHSHVIGRARNLNANREDPDEDLSQLLASHEANVAWIVLLLVR